MASDFLTSGAPGVGELIVGKPYLPNMVLSGTNFARAADYNWRLVLQVVRQNPNRTRTEISNITGLSSPTISGITKMLFERELIHGAGSRTGGRGQPAEQICINPDGALAIGLAIDRDRISLISLDLAGVVRSRFTCPGEFAVRDDLCAILRQGIDKIIGDAAISREKILGMGVAVPDEAADTSVAHAADIRPSKYMDIVQLLTGIAPLPVYMDNDVAAAAVGEANFGSNLLRSSFFYIFVGNELGGAVVIDGACYRRTKGRSDGIGSLPLDFAGSFGAKLQDVLSAEKFRNLREQEMAFGASGPQVVRAESAGAPMERWVNEAALALVPALIGINCLINPHEIVISGSLPAEILDSLLLKARKNLNNFASDIPVRTSIRRAAILHDAKVVGAASLPFVDRVLPSNTTLMKTAVPGANVVQSRRLEARSRKWQGPTQF
jgi:predicted NBD/HSP70 family sugar kinase